MFFEKQVQEAKAGLVRAELALKARGVDGMALKVSSSAALEGVARLKAQISVQEVKIAAMRGYLAGSASDFKQAQTELAALRNQMDKADKSEGASGGCSDYVARFREFKYHQTLLALYMRQFELARVDESREGAMIQVVGSAQAPERKSKRQEGVDSRHHHSGHWHVVAALQLCAQRRAVGRPVGRDSRENGPFAQCLGLSTRPGLRP